MFSLVEQTHGPLSIVERATPRDEIARALARTDPSLRVERHLKLGGELVWAVVSTAFSPPRTVYEHRDDYGTPIPFLSERLLDRFRRREQESLLDVVRAADRANDQHRLELRRKADDGYETSADEMRRMAGRVAAVPRSQALRMSRDKARARGENV